MFIADKSEHFSSYILWKQNVFLYIYCTVTSQCHMVFFDIIFYHYFKNKLSFKVFLLLSILVSLKVVYNRLTALWESRKCLWKFKWLVRAQEMSMKGWLPCVSPESDYERLTALWESRKWLWKVGCLVRVQKGWPNNFCIITYTLVLCELIYPGNNYIVMFQT